MEIYLIVLKIEIGKKNNNRFEKRRHLIPYGPIKVMENRVHIVFYHFYILRENVTPKP